MKIDWNKPSEIIDNLMKPVKGSYVNCELCGASLGYFEYPPDIAKHDNIEDCIKYLRATKKDICM
jgi:hypothetical protein